MSSVSFELPESSRSLAQPPSITAYAVDRLFFAIATIGALAIIALVAYILYEIGYQAFPAIQRYGASFLVDTQWDVQKSHFGILPQIWGTLYSSLLALLIGGFVGVTIAVFLTQDFLPPRLAVSFRTLIEMLAAIPSVVFGLWGIFVVIPFIRPGANWLNEHFSSIPFFSSSLSGPGLLPAVIVLAIMILPTVAAISQDAIGLVPYRVKEAAYGMGTTKWEAILKVILPTASAGISSALVLGFGRALGRDDGARHADWQLQPNLALPLLSGEYASGPPRIQFSGSCANRTSGSDVRRARPAGDHADRQHHRDADLGLHIQENGEGIAHGSRRLIRRRWIG